MKSVAKARAVKPGTPAPSRDPAAGKEAVNAAIGLFNRRWVLRSWSNLAAAGSESSASQWWGVLLITSPTVLPST